MTARAAITAGIAGTAGMAGAAPAAAGTGSFFDKMTDCQTE